MKHLFNDIPNSEKQRILEMHGVKTNLIKESTEMESALSNFESLEDGEKMSWKDAIFACIEELGLSNKIKRDSEPFIYLAALAAAGVVLGIGALVGMAVLPAVFIGVVEKPMINKIIKCAREKRKSIHTSSPTSTSSDIPQQKD